MGDGVNKRERARVRPAFGALPFFGGQRREARCTVSGGGGCGGDYRTPQLDDVSLDTQIYTIPQLAEVSSL